MLYSVTDEKYFNYFDTWHFVSGVSSEILTKQF